MFSWRGSNVYDGHFLCVVLLIGELLYVEGYSIHVLPVVSFIINKGELLVSYTIIIYLKCIYT